MNLAAPALPDQPETIPVVIVSEEKTAGLRIAGVSLLDRLVVVAHQAGCFPIIVVSSSARPPLDRARALEIPVHVTREPPIFTRPVLLASTSVLVTAADLRAVIKGGGRLVGEDGTPLPVGIANSSSAVDEALAPLAPVRAGDVARRVVDGASARDAERALWDGTKSAADGLVDRLFNRPCGRPLSRLLVWTPVSPNAVSLASVAVGLMAAWFFADGDYLPCLAAAVLFQISAIVDCVDGDLARVAFKQSLLGKWLDIIGDQVVHVAVFGGIALGLMKTGYSTPALWLGLIAIIGAITSFAVVVRGLWQSDRQCSGPLQKLIDSATNRDFSVLVLLCAALSKLEWFLCLAAVGSHLFWLTAVALQVTARPGGVGAR